MRWLTRLDLGLGYALSLPWEHRPIGHRPLFPSVCYRQSAVITNPCHLMLACNGLSQFKEDAGRASTCPRIWFQSMPTSPIMLKNSLPGLVSNPCRRESQASQASRHVAHYQWFSHLNTGTGIPVEDQILHVPPPLKKIRRLVGGNSESVFRRIICAANACCRFPIRPSVFPIQASGSKIEAKLYFWPMYLKTDGWMGEMSEWQNEVRPQRLDVR